MRISWCSNVNEEGEKMGRMYLVLKCTNCNFEQKIEISTENFFMAWKMMNSDYLFLQGNVLNRVNNPFHTCPRCSQETVEIRINSLSS